MGVIRPLLREFSWQQRLLLATVASACLPFPITVLCILATVITLLLNSQARKTAFCFRTDLIAWFFCGLCIIVPLCYGRYISVVAGIGLLIGFILFLFLKALMTEKLFLSTIDACCITSVSCFIIGVIQKIINGQSFRATGGLFNANYYGTVCEFIIIFIICRLCTKSASVKFYLPLLVINIIGIFLCDCQSSWIAVMAGCVVLLLTFKGKKVAAIAIVGFLIVLIIGVFTPGLLPRLEHLPQSFITRKNIWDTAWQMFLAHPLFGQGALTYWFSNEIYGGYKTYHSHSLYLDPLVSYGIVGVSTLLLYAAASARRVTALISGAKNRTIFAIVAGTVAAVLIHGITDNTLLWVQTGVLVVFVFSGLFVEREKLISNNADSILSE